MKVGDEVFIVFWDDMATYHGIVSYCSEDGRNATIKTDKGGFMNGMVRYFITASLFE